MWVRRCVTRLGQPHLTCLSPGWGMCCLLLDVPAPVPDIRRSCSCLMFRLNPEESRTVLARAMPSFTTYPSLWPPAPTTTLKLSTPGSVPPAWLATPVLRMSQLLRSEGPAFCRLACSGNDRSFKALSSGGGRRAGRGLLWVGRAARLPVLGSSTCSCWDATAMLVLVGFTAGIVSPRASCSFVCIQVGGAGAFLAKVGEVVWPGLLPLVPPAPHLFWAHSCLQVAFHPEQNRSSCCPAPKAAMAHGPLPYSSLKLIRRAARALYAPVTQAWHALLLSSWSWHRCWSGLLAPDPCQSRRRFCKCPDRHSLRCCSWWIPAQVHSSLSQAPIGTGLPPTPPPAALAWPCLCHRRFAHPSR